MQAWLAHNVVKVLLYFGAGFGTRVKAALLLLKPTKAGLVFRTLTGTTRRLENSFLCLTYIAETLVVGDGTRLALATYYDTLYVSV